MDLFRFRSNWELSGVEDARREGRGDPGYRAGGFAAAESVDGKFFYAKERFRNPNIYRVPAGGGLKCSCRIKCGRERGRGGPGWSAGVIFSREEDGAVTLNYLDFTEQGGRKVANVEDYTN